MTFREWFAENLAEYAHDIANHGADAGYPHITYTSDTVAVFDVYADDIWEMAIGDSEELGHKNVADMIAGFTRSDMLQSYNEFRNLMVWYACEKVAREIDDAAEAEG